MQTRREIYRKLNKKFRKKIKHLNEKGTELNAQPKFEKNIKNIFTKNKTVRDSCRNTNSVNKKRTSNR